jgi:extracellular elastinolytic metalloproteinase
MAAHRSDGSFDMRASRAGIPNLGAAARKAQSRLRRSLHGGAVVDADPITGTPRVVVDTNGLLTGPSSSGPAAVALGFVRRHSAAFGSDLGDLQVVRQYASADGVTHLTWAQQVGGVPVLDRALRANVTSGGRLLNIGGGPVPSPNPDTLDPRLSAREAVQAAAAYDGTPVALGRSRSLGGPTRATVFAGGASAQLVLFPERDRLRLAWRTILSADSTHVWDTVLDAETGSLLRRDNQVMFANSGLAFDYYPGAPSGGSQVTKAFSNSGSDPWLTVFTRLQGNNALVYSDPNDVLYSNAEANGTPPGPPTAPSPLPSAGNQIPPSSGIGTTDAVWNYVQDASTYNNVIPQQVCPLAGCTYDDWTVGGANSWQTNLNQAGTNLFYLVNSFHDHLLAAPIGFDEASGNFEQTNSTGIGVGGDPVHAQVDDGANTDGGFPDPGHTNNANMTIPPDGSPPRMQMYLFSDFPGITGRITDVAGADDAEIVYHEYAHGLSSRLVSDSSGYGALNSDQAGAMGEGWSDWYAMDFLNQGAFKADTGAPGEVSFGTYEGLNPGIRTQALDCPVGAPAACPGADPSGGNTGPGGYTYGDFGEISARGPEVHADGEIWAETLWDLRQALIAAHCTGPGISRAEQLVTGGMRLDTVDDPSYLDMRDAILAEDTATGGADQALIWAVFSRRGMGDDASTSSGFDDTPVEGFHNPAAGIGGGPGCGAGGGAIDTTPPNTSIRKVNVVGHTATIRFASSEPGSHFTCRLDQKHSAACRSPKKYRVRKVGRHKVRVDAIDASGNSDPSPAVARFRIR